MMITKPHQLSFIFRISTLAFGLLGLAREVSAVQLLANGDFESGSFAGWTSTAQTGSSGDRFIDTPGSTSPISGASSPANASGGSFYAVTDQSGPGSYSLTQAFTIPSIPSSVILSFQMFNQTNAAVEVGASLDYVGGANQHARVDLLTASAAPFDLGAAVLQNFYIGTDSSIPAPAYASYSFDITTLVSTPGTYQLRFAQVDNQGFFQQGVDNVSIEFTAIPEPSIEALGMLSLSIVFCRRSRSAPL